MTYQNCSISLARRKYGSPSELHVWECRFYASLASVKPLGKNIDPNTRIWLFNHVSTRVLGDSSFFTNRNTLGVWERLLEAIRGVGKLSLLLLGSPSSSMEVLPLLGLRGWWTTNLISNLDSKDVSQHLKNHKSSVRTIHIKH